MPASTPSTRHPIPDAPAVNPDRPPPTDQPPANGHGHQRTGSIARLPKEIRRQVNLMLDDGFTYKQIIKALGDHGKNLNQDHVRRWKSGGYQDYLREQRILQQCRLRLDRAFRLLDSDNNINAFQATQQVAISQICEAIAEVGPDALRDALAASPMNYFRMLNAFSRLTGAGINCERQLDAHADHVAKTQDPVPDDKKGISPSSLKQMEEKLNLL